MSLAVVGAGLVSPGGITPRDHAFFLPPGVLAPGPSPFVKADHARIDVRYCSWLGARLPIAERLVRMAQAAVHEACSSCGDALEGQEVPLFVCASRPRPGLGEADHRTLVDALRLQLRARDASSVWGAAGAFAAVREARARITGGARAAMVVAADSHVHVDAVAEDTARAPSWWALERQPLSEGAAALLLTDVRIASQRRMPVLGIIVESQVARGTSTDDDDEIVDGAAMTTALRALPGTGKVEAIFGQYMLDNLRHREWIFAEARNAARFDPEYVNATIETRLGRLGAAAGLFNLTYGIAALHHDTMERELAVGASLLAWAISRDGTRGIALVRRAT
jgi:hypothetical protein